MCVRGFPCLTTFGANDSPAPPRAQAAPLVQLIKVRGPRRGGAGRGGAGRGGAGRGGAGRGTPGRGGVEWGGVGWGGVGWATCSLEDLLWPGGMQVVPKARAIRSRDAPTSLLIAVCSRLDRHWLLASCAEHFTDAWDTRACSCVNPKI